MFAPPFLARRAADPQEMMRILKVAPPPPEFSPFKVSLMKRAALTLSPRTGQRRPSHELFAP